MKYGQPDNIPKHSKMNHLKKRGKRPIMHHKVLSALSAIAMMAFLGLSQPVLAADSQSREAVTGFSFKEMMNLESINFFYQEKFAVSCLIYSFYRSWFSVQINIYSTYKVDRCVPATFLNTTAASAHAQIATIHKIDFVQMAGPHIQMMDRNETPLQNPYVYIGSMKYSPIARAKIGLTDLIAHYRENKNWFRQLSFYTPLPTIGDVGFTWFPGSTIYTIVTDTGRVFIMTNMSATRQYASAADVEEAASTLGKFLSLPKGWRYETQKTKDILSIKRSAYEATLSHYMQDEFGNIYLEVTGEIR